MIKIIIKVHLSFPYLVKICFSLTAKIYSELVFGVSHKKVELTSIFAFDQTLRTLPKTAI